MKRTALSFSAAIFLGVCVAAAPAMAQGRGGGGGAAMHGPPSTMQRPSQAQSGSRGMGQEHGMKGSHSAGVPSGHGAVEHLDQHPEQAARMQDLLPAGTDVHQAADGFKNWGQFVSAAHVSKNLNIPFDQLKTKMTGPDSVSLGKAIAEMRPDLSKSEVKSSVKEAKRFEEQETKAEKKQTKTSAQRREK